MLRDITIGQYYPSGSIIHRLDPRVKFAGTFVYIVSLFVFKTFWGFLPAAVWLITLVIMARIPVKYLLKGLRPMLFLLLFMAAMRSDRTMVDNKSYQRGNQIGGVHEPEACASYHGLLAHDIHDHADCADGSDGTHFQTLEDNKGAGA